MPSEQAACTPGLDFLSTCSWRGSVPLCRTNHPKPLPCLWLEHPSADGHSQRAISFFPTPAPPEPDVRPLTLTMIHCMTPR